MKIHLSNIDTVCRALEESFNKYDWFFGAEIEPNKQSIVIYVESMGPEISIFIPNTLDNFQIKMAFADFARCGSKYGKENATTLDEAISKLTKQ